MIAFRTVLPLMALAALSVAVRSGAATPPPGGALLITGVAVIDPANGTVTPAQDIFIKDGRIAAVASTGAVPVPSGTPTLDGVGRFAVPGLIDVHAHIGEGGALPNTDASRERALRQFLRYGVTTIFVPGATGAGDADWQGLRARCRSAALACPGLYGSGSLITAKGSHPVSTIFGMPDDVPAATTEARGVTVLQGDVDIPALIAAKKAAGVDAIKIVVEDGPPPWYPKPRLSDGQIGAIVAAAHARSLQVFSHISTAAHVRVLLDAGADGIMHAPTDRLPDETIQRMAKRRMWYVPTFALYDGILTWARKLREADSYALKGVEPAVIESLAAAPFLAGSAEDEAGALAYIANASDNLRRAAAAGVPIALGSDVNNPFVYPGYSVHEELSWMVRAGLTPARALAAATTGSAAFLRASDRLGRIAEGFEADLLLLARNPLEQIENSRSIVAVLADGKLVPQPISVD
jgi:imidazolonepropionase-like amidohydrolase